jgi:hypothetical protein
MAHRRKKARHDKHQWLDERMNYQSKDIDVTLPLKYRALTSVPPSPPGCER